MNSTTITQEETQDNIIKHGFLVFDHIAEAQIDKIIECHLSQPIWP